VGTTGIPRDTDLGERLRKNPLPNFTHAAPTEEQVQAPRLSPQRTQETTSASASSPAAPTKGLTPGNFNPNDFAQPVFDEPKKTFLTRDPASQRSTPKVAPSPLISLGHNLRELDEKVASCTLCPLHKERTQTVFSRGSGKSGICFIGESPTPADDAKGEPFVDEAGVLLDKMIAAMGIDRDDVYVCNLVKCAPPEERHATSPEKKSCAPYLERQIELLNPKVIVALGGTAVNGLLGIHEGITKVRGRFRLYKGRLAVMPTFHPAYLLRNGSAKKQVWADLRQVLHHIGRPLPSKG